MSFGLKNVSTTLHWAIDVISSLLLRKFAVMYLDAIVVLLSSTRDHGNHVKEFWTF